MKRSVKVVQKHFKELYITNVLPHQSLYQWNECSPKLTENCLAVNVSADLLFLYIIIIISKPIFCILTTFFDQCEVYIYIVLTSVLFTIIPMYYYLPVPGDLSFF